MKTSTVLLGVGGVAVVGGLVYYFYNKNKTTAAAAQQLAPAMQQQQLTPGSSPIAPAPAVKQSMWKDVDGNIFELTSDKQRWGYVIKVNGSIQGKSNQMEAMVLGPDGYMVGCDNNGSCFVYKNGGWQNVVRDNKTAAGDYLKKLGVTKYLNGLNGLNSAFILN